MQVSIFTAPVCDETNAEAALERLTEADRLRLQGMKSTKRRCEFLSGRLLAQQSLAAIYGRQSLLWVLEAQPSGALRLANVHNAPEISLSHSRGRVVCALAEAPSLGVDVEQIRPRKNLSGLALEVLHPDELTEFSQLDGDCQADFFYTKWVIKEALGKALGCGVHYPMCEVLLHGKRLMAAPRSWISSPEEWQFSHTLLPGGYSLGAAWQGGPANSISIKNVEIRI